MKFYNICTKQTYTDKKGKPKNKWFTIGTLKETDDGKRFITLYIMPNENFYAFEQDVNTERRPRQEDETVINYDELSIL